MGALSIDVIWAIPDKLAGFAETARILKGRAAGASSLTGNVTCSNHSFSAPQPRPTEISYADLDLRNSPPPMSTASTVGYLAAALALSEVCEGVSFIRHAFIRD
jgi:hypothetical protein